MRISCEKCKTLFQIQDKDLSSKGATVLCPKCQHPHLAKRVVIPYGDLKKDSKTEKSIQDFLAKERAKKNIVKNQDNTLVRDIKRTAGETTKGKTSTSADPLVDNLEANLKGKNKKAYTGPKTDKEITLEKMIERDQDKYVDLKTYADIGLDKSLDYIPSEITIEKDLGTNTKNRKTKKTSPVTLLMGATLIILIIVIILAFLTKFS